MGSLPHRAKSTVLRHPQQIVISVMQGNECSALRKAFRVGARQLNRAKVLTPLTQCERVCTTTRQRLAVSGDQSLPGQMKEGQSYWLIATPLKAATPMDFDLATDVRSP
jgi:hypothetical protein